RNDRPYGLKCAAFQTEIALFWRMRHAGAADAFLRQPSPGSAKAALMIRDDMGLDSVLDFL
ncbi:hypothetical protein, partial [uncultured Desulfovibrio sp.]|uniref:hypothetical protein n=1 Tax=uncultured Desulfovibrio sp. TaxID=167968 RepID=UPI0026338ED2